ncbi:Glycosyl transferase family 8 [Musa troglodytarum]|uniref:Glycosyl transferase family 8 n=1 Tax=Musa troglodytarum TaxID=320322 RepID=A0A9E7HZW4_9LILI|nr:Glycosyl transferase family 8 [Musa troglodytarum]
MDRSLVLSLFFVFLCSSAARDAREQSPSAVVVGTVYCDTCFHQEFSKFSHLISGASVAVECGDAASGRGYSKVVTTNRQGVFGVRLPPRISKHVHLIESCSVKLLKSNEPFCAVASTATAAGLRLKSGRRGVHVYSVGFFSFKPLNEPELCYQKPVLEAEKQEQFSFFLPLPTVTFQPSPPQGAGGFPLFQPPTLLPPNPLQPPASVLPPSPSFNLPPFPSSTLPPALPFPRFPGVPSAFPSKTTSP